MTTKKIPSWPLVRSIIQSWLDLNGYKPGRLADEAGIDRTNFGNFLKFVPTKEKKKHAISERYLLKICLVMFPKMNPINRREFLSAAGLSMLYQLIPYLRPFETATATVVDSDEPDQRKIKAAQAYGTATESWEGAIPIFRNAQNLSGRDSADVARFSDEIIQMYLNLGDFRSAHEELNMIEKEYEAVIGPEILANLNLRKGWLLRDEGHYAESAKFLKSALELSKVTGAKKTEGSALHFLGGVYLPWGIIRKNKLFLQEAEQNLRSAIQIRQRLEPRSDLAFDHLYLHRLDTFRGRDRDAFVHFEKTSRILVTYPLGVPQVDLAQANMDYLEGRVERPKDLALKAMEVWSDVGYAKGISDSLKLLGFVEFSQQHPKEAIKLFAASIIIYPFGGDLRNAEHAVLERISDAYMQIIGESRRGVMDYKELIDNIEEAAFCRLEPFDQLERITANRDEVIKQLIRRLSTIRGRILK